MSTPELRGGAFSGDQFAQKGGHLVYPDAGRWIEHDPPAERHERDERPEVVERGANVDDDDVAHFLRITPDPDEPDLCGGCGRKWEDCPERVRLNVGTLPTFDPDEQERMRIAVAAARKALDL